MSFNQHLETYLPLVIRWLMRDKFPAVCVGAGMVLAAPGLLPILLVLLDRQTSDIDVAAVASPIDIGFRLAGLALIFIGVGFRIWNEIARAREDERQSLADITQAHQEMHPSRFIAAFRRAFRLRLSQPEAIALLSDEEDPLTLIESYRRAGGRLKWNGTWFTAAPRSWLMTVFLKLAGLALPVYMFAAFFVSMMLFGLGGSLNAAGLLTISLLCLPVHLMLLRSLAETKHADYVVAAGQRKKA